MNSKVAVILLVSVFIAESEMENKVEDSLAHNLTISLTKLISYYEKNYMYMNLDGMYGLRVLEGQMKNILQTNLDKPAWLMKKLQYLHQISAEVCKKSIPYVKDSNPGYYNQLNPFIEEQVVKDKPYRRISLQVKWPKERLKFSGMSESFSDHCMSELLGTGKAAIPCSPSMDCLETMFEDGHQEYVILHQLLYTIVAEQNNCDAEIEQYLESIGFVGGISQIQHIFCSNNLFEIVELINEIPNEDIPYFYRDLFLEQQYVCPSQGYMEFLHEIWLKQILSWQHERGCFMMNPGNSRQENQEDSLNSKIHQQHQPFDSDNNVLKPNPNGDVKEVQKLNNMEDLEKFANGLHKSRHLLEDRTLHDGCSSHLTAVAAAALSQYLKFLVNPGSSQYQANVHIKGVNYLLHRTWQNMLNRDQKISENENKEKLHAKNTDSVYQNAMNVPKPENLKEQIYNEGILNFKENLEYNPEIPFVKNKDLLNNGVILDHSIVPKLRNLPIVNSDNKRTHIDKHIYPRHFYRGNLRNVEKSRTHGTSHNSNSVTFRKSDIMPANGISVLKSYAIVMAIALVLLVYMYRFIRKRRLIIRYR